MRVLEGSEIAYDDQAHRWIVLGYVYSSTGAHTPSTAYDEEDEPDTVRERMRAYMHAEYLARPKDSPSIVGTYLIDCKALYDPWPDQPILSIRTTSLPGVYQASYNFGRTMGPIMLSTDRKLLAYFTGEDGEEHGEEDEEEDGEEDREEDGGEMVRTTGIARKPRRRFTKSPRLSRWSTTLSCAPGASTAGT